MIHGTPALSLSRLASDGRHHGAIAAEVAVARALIPLALRPGVEVFHDLTLPGTREPINIDHIVLVDGLAVVIDTKYWASGWYWTRRGVTHRGFHPAPHADRRGLSFTMDLLTKRVNALSLIGRAADNVVGLAAVVTAGTGRVHIKLYRPPGANTSAIPAHRLVRHVEHLIKGHGAPDQAYVQWLAGRCTDATIITSLHVGTGHWATDGITHERHPTLTHINTRGSH